MTLTIVFGVTLLCLALLPSRPTAALSSGLLINTVQVRGTPTDASAAYVEMVEVINASDQTIDATNWCIGYGQTAAQKGCLTMSAGVHLLLDPGQTAVLATSAYHSAAPGARVDAAMTQGLSNTSGKISLLDPANTVVDDISWATSQQGDSVVYLATNEIGMTRSSAVDSDLASDFSQHFTETYVTTYQPGYEVADVCNNLDGIQTEPPAGYESVDGACNPLPPEDMCENIDGIQSEVPAGMVQDTNNQCTSPDVCQNIDGLQTEPPSGYIQKEQNCFDNHALQITELLPNVTGTDEGKEFIELYNPYDTDISLEGYRLEIGKQYEKSVSLPLDIHATIPSHGYVTFSDTQLGIVLLNTTSSVRLVNPAGTVVSDTSYTAPQDDLSWALINDIWQYTNQPTPGAANLASIADDSTSTSSSQVNILQPCGEGRYRNTLTNRCRNIESDAAVLASCASDEYRNPETNRCRKLTAAVSTLTPCQAGYERNPETNRCRKLTSSSTSTLTPCQVGYERNPETNRCRKIVAATTSPSLAAIDSSSVQASNQTLNSVRPWLLAGLVSIVVGYGLWEWRQEIGGAFRKVFRR